MGLRVHGSHATSVPQHRLIARQLEAALVAALRKTMFVSETDFRPEVMSSAKPFPANKPLTAKDVMKVFEGPICGMLDEQGGNLEEAGWTAKAYGRAEAKEFWADVTTPTGRGEYGSGSFSKGWKELKAVVDANLKDAIIVKVGPKGDDGKLAVDQGTYVYNIVGRAANGRLAGVQWVSVET